MSYEGYEDRLCKNGHHWQKDVHGGHNVCPHCRKKAVWANSVDQTNCEDVGLITPKGWESLLIQPEKTETCGHCNHTKTIEPARYRIPSEEEMKKLRHMRITKDNGRTELMNLYEYTILSDVLEG